MENELKERKVLNPELEALRNKLLQEEILKSVEARKIDLLELTSKIHASFLFYSPKTLQTLVRSIAESTNSLMDLGWHAFGHHLGLDMNMLKVISNNSSQEDPTYNTILHFVQHPDATLGKIVEALTVMGRFDVLHRIKQDLKDLAQLVVDGNLHSTISSSDSAYGSGSLSSISESVLRPTVFPTAPFVLKNFQNEPFISNALLESQQVCETSISTREEELYTKNVKPSEEKIRKYGKVALLTFAEDGKEIAKRIASIFRRQRDNLPRLGVVILEEQAHIVARDPEQFVLGAFHQVDYVCPIITENYLKTILRKERPLTANPDATHVHFIYKLMMDYYIKNQCLNDKIRCVIDDGFLEKAMTRLVMAVPIFSAWELVSKAEQLAVRLLKSEF